MKILILCLAALFMPHGAYDTGEYHNYVSEVLGVSHEQVQERLDQLWEHFFTPGDFSKYADNDQTTVYYEPDDSTAFIYDTGSNDVRTEGMSYGMMICVQMDKPEQFARLWRWTKKYMAFPEDSPWNGYFCWNCKADGTHLGRTNASDGEVYFITALFMAAHRWNEPSYAADAMDILDKCMSKDGSRGVWNLYDDATHLVTFVPSSGSRLYTDPSYQLPAFVQLWSEWDESRSGFWKEAADAARGHLRTSAHPVTGLYPDYSTFAGEPFRGRFSSYDTRRYQYDAIRCAMNVGMDYYLFGTDADAQSEQMERLLTFFRKDQFRHGQFDLDGTNTTGGYSQGMAGANAVGAIALKDKELQRVYMERLWKTSAPRGRWRYYSGMVYMLSMLHVTGNFRIY